MYTIMKKTMAPAGKGWRWAGPLAAVIALAGLGAAEANELGFGMVGIAPGQTARINAVRWVSEWTGNPAPCLAELTFLDRKGNVLKALPAVKVEPNQAISLDFDAGQSVPDAPEKGVRAMVKAVVDADLVTDPTQADPCEVIGTLEVFDNETGRTDIVLTPGVIRAFNPQPDPPKAVR